MLNIIPLRFLMGQRERGRLRHYATSREDTGSISDVIEFFSRPNPSSHTMVLESNQPLKELSTPNLPGGVGG
jgi:hypothetical protein